MELFADPINFYHTALYGWLDLAIYTVGFWMIIKATMVRKGSDHKDMWEKLAPIVGFVLGLSLTAFTLAKGYTILDMIPVALVIAVLGILATVRNWFKSKQEGDKRKHSFWFWFLAVVIILLIFLYFQDWYGKYISTSASRWVMAILVLLLACYAIYSLFRWLATHNQKSNEKNWIGNIIEGIWSWGNKPGKDYGGKALRGIKGWWGGRKKGKDPRGKPLKQLKVNIAIKPRQRFKGYIKGKGTQFVTFTAAVENAESQLIYIWEIEGYEFPDQKLAHKDKCLIDINQLELKRTSESRQVRLFVLEERTGREGRASETITIKEPEEVLATLTIISPWKSEQTGKANLGDELVLQAQVKTKKQLQKIVWAYIPGIHTGDITAKLASATGLGNVNKFKKKFRVFTEESVPLTKEFSPSEGPGKYTIICIGFSSKGPIENAIDVIYIDIKDKPTTENVEIEITKPGKKENTGDIDLEVTVISGESKISEYLWRMVDTAGHETRETTTSKTGKITIPNAGNYTLYCTAIDKSKTTLETVSKNIIVSNKGTGPTEKVEIEILSPTTHAAEITPKRNKDIPLKVKVTKGGPVHEFGWVIVRGKIADIATVTSADVIEDLTSKGISGATGTSSSTIRSIDDIEKAGEINSTNTHISIFVYALDNKGDPLSEASYCFVKIPAGKGTGPTPKVNLSFLPIAAKIIAKKPTRLQVVALPNRTYTYKWRIKKK